MKNFFKDFLLDSVFVSMLTIVAGILITVFHSMALDIISILCYNNINRIILEGFIWLSAIKDFGNY